MNKQGEGKIEYLDWTWNPVTGCLHKCPYCYAKKIAKRFYGADLEGTCGNKWIRRDNPFSEPYDHPKLFEVNSPLTKYISHSGRTMYAPYPFGFEPTFHRYRLGEPAQVKKPSIIGVVYMGDLFGEWVPDEWITEIMIAISQAPQHIYVFLTKNPDRYYEYFNNAFQDIPEEYKFDNIKMWLGATITKQDELNKIWPRTLHILDFFSIEPLLCEVDLEAYLYDEQYIDYRTSEWRAKWVIVGQQTNPSRPPKPEWVQAIIDQCREADVPVFVKSPLYQQFPIQEYPEGLVKG